jgi:hypothetical protein
MPVLRNDKVEAGKIVKDDVVKGRTAAVVKIGTKFRGDPLLRGRPRS